MLLKMVPNKDQIFQIKNESDFTNLALKIFRYQASKNNVYKQFLSILNINPATIKTIEDIPFLPIQFFKNHRVTTVPPPYDLTFKSSGTTGMQRSIHYVKNKELYQQSFIRSFEYFFGNIKDYTILALLPSYMEQGESSLVYMTKQLMKISAKEDNGFYLYNMDELADKLNTLEAKKQKTLLIGVSYALLDFVEKYKFKLQNTLVMETGGMKGRKKEILREELHLRLKQGFGVENIYSEYGMTELLSQSYSKGNGIFETPPWKKILIRDTEDPFTYLPNNKTGGINVIDLANIYSCSFIATQDLGQKIDKNQFKIMGRFDNSDIRGCNLLVVT